MSRFVHESLWNLVWFTIGFLKWNGWERFSSDLQIESSRQENVTKPRCAQISPKQKSWFFVTFLTKGLWGWSWEGGGRSMTFIRRIGISGKFCTNSPQVFQAQVLVWFMPSLPQIQHPNRPTDTHHFPCRHPRLISFHFTPVTRSWPTSGGFLLLCWFRHSYIRDVHFFPVSLSLLLNL